MDAMQQDADLSKIQVLRVDGGASNNNLLMQMQADALQVEQSALPLAGVSQHMLFMARHPLVLLQSDITQENVLYSKKGKALKSPLICRVLLRHQLQTCYSRLACWHQGM